MIVVYAVRLCRPLIVPLSCCLRSASHAFRVRSSRRADPAHLSGAMARLLALCIVLSVVAVAQARVKAVGISPFVVNGSDASPGEFPYEVSVQKFGVHYCAGTIINKDWILTAAHCVDNELAAELLVVAGTVQLSNGGVESDVDYYVKHSGYNASNAYENDIALIKLATSLTMSTYIQPVTLPAALKHTPGGVTATVIGWGLLYSGGPASDVLQKVDLVTYSDAACKAALAGYTHAHNLCAGWPDGGKGHCSGDSGGPLLVNGVQVGIVSWSVKPCASAGYPGVYTEVSFFVSWISRNAQD